MPSTKTDSESTNEPWKGYQPYLTGTGPLPYWVTQGAPTGLTPDLAADMAGRAAGAEGSWLSPPPMTFPSGDFGAFTAPQQGAPPQQAPQIPAGLLDAIMSSRMGAGMDNGSTFGGW